MSTVIMPNIYYNAMIFGGFTECNYIYGKCPNINTSKFVGELYSPNIHKSCLHKASLLAEKKISS